MYSIHTQIDVKDRRKAMGISIAIHAALLLALILFVMKTPIPPFPEPGGGGGVLVNIGYVDLASGAIQPLSENVTKGPQPEKVQPVPKTQEEKIVTQETEEAVAVHEAKKDTKKDIKKTTTAAVQPVKEAPKVPERKADRGSLYAGKNNNSKSQGTAATGTGDQGERTGDPFSKYTGKGGTGGGPGSGDGTGGGNGSGNGPGTGNGISFDLAGRSLLHKPSIDDKSQLTGRVVVNITVDKSGAVVSAIPGGRGSTTTSEYLFGKAKEAAMRAKFSPSEADIQKGTMTFVFLVQ
jgi:outer membrane biosynthesis protein TonB